MQRVGLISDTHGLLRPEAAAFLEGCSHIVHGGDVCDPAIVEALERIAPVTVVRGNNDKGKWADALPCTEFIQFGTCCVYVIHDISELDLDPSSAGVHVVVFGHSHKPEIYERHGVFYVNPGSAGPRRFSLPVSVGELVLSGASVSPRVVELKCV